MKKDKPLPFPDLGIKTSDKLVISETTKYLLDNPDAMTKGFPLSLLVNPDNINRPDQYKSDVFRRSLLKTLKVEQQDDTVSYRLTEPARDVSHPGMGVVADYTLDEKLLLEGAKIPTGFAHLNEMLAGGLNRGDFLISLSASVALHKSRLLRNGIIGARSNHVPFLSSELGESVENLCVRMLGGELDAKPFDLVETFERLIKHSEMRHPPFSQNLIRFQILAWRYSAYNRALHRRKFLSDLRFPENIPKPPLPLFFGPARFNPAMVPITYLSLTPTNKMIIEGSPIRHQFN